MRNSSFHLEIEMTIVLVALQWPMVPSHICLYKIIVNHNFFRLFGGQFQVLLVGYISVYFVMTKLLVPVAMLDGS